MYEKIPKKYIKEEIIILKNNQFTWFQHQVSNEINPRRKKYLVWSKNGAKYYIFPWCREILQS